MRKIKIIKNKGEISIIDGFEFHHAGIIEKIPSSDKEVEFQLKGFVVQEKLNTKLKVDLAFDNEEDAVQYMSTFIKENPISELILLEKSSKELYHYI